MNYLFKVRCATCGFPNELKIGRVYNRLLCKQCGAEIDTDASVTLDLLMDTKPVALKRDTVTVGFRTREEEDRAKCDVCGTEADLEAEDVLEVGKKYKCRQCGNEFDIVVTKKNKCAGAKPTGS
jgi:predicted RNA-binding Zn-ribbon protein involved in translation (DUF1610 family)